MGRSFEYIGLSDGILEVVVFDQECLAKDLHSHWMLLFIRFEINLEDFAKSAHSELLLNLKRLECDSIHAIVQQFILDLQVLRITLL